MLNVKQLSVAVLVCIGLSVPYIAGAAESSSTPSQPTHVRVVSKVHGKSGADYMIGTTPDQVQSNFASVIESTFANGSSEHVLGNLSDLELANIAKYYRASQQKNGKQDDAVLAILASRLSDRVLVRVSLTSPRLQ